MVSAVNEPLLDERLAALEEARAWSPRLISKLESHIRSADDLALFRINAFSFAKERHLAESEIIDLFLHATALGLFSMDWSLYCCRPVSTWPASRYVSSRFSTANVLPDHARRFADLFRSEVIKAREGIAVRDIALLFTDLKGSTALYDRIGDLNAFALVQRHFDLLQDVVTRHHGAIIKTIGDAVMATFLEPADAVAAALSMRNEIDAFNRKQADRALILKIGIHKGAAIAVTLNERLDYFGQTVNIAARVQQLADAEEIFVSEDVYSAEGVQALLGSREVVSNVFKLKGVQQDLRVFRITKDPAAW